MSELLIERSAVLKGGEDGVSYCFEVTVEGRVESQDAGYDVVYLNGQRLFSSLNLKDGEMVTLEAKRTISLKPGESITLGYDTRDDRYHTGAYAKISEILPLQGCANNTCQPGNAKVRLGSVNFAVSAGTRSDGKTAGDMWIDEHYPSSSLATPHTLKFESTGAEVDVVTNGYLRQIKAHSGLVDIAVINDFKYEIRFYGSADVGEKTNGLYLIQGAPFKTWSLENPESTNSFNTLRVTEKNGTQTNQVYLYQWDEVNSKWTLARGSGSEARFESMAETTGYDGTYSNSVYAFTIRNATNELVFARSETYTLFPWGKEKTQEVLDPEGLALTNRWFYYTEADVPSTNDLNYGKLSAILTSDGYWETYSHGHNGSLETSMQYLNSAFGETNRIISRNVAVYRDVKIVVTEETLLGELVSRSWEFVGAQTRAYTVAIEDGGYSEGNYNGATATQSSSFDSQGRTLTSADWTGKQTTYAYSTNGVTNITTTVHDGITTVREEDSFGRLIKTARYHGTNAIDYMVVQERDSEERPALQMYSDGTTEEM
ncbi:MAG: hypothetical protein U1E27_01415, partial [Kiritimatiellia bacterium]|nr:hypothetical protein [Kiritimatiellia bacterium]